jgi:predicted nuclease of predicted toxin-antitoxin system
MALRFLADHCISNTIIRALRDAAHEVVRLRDVLPVESPDMIVIAKAQEIDAILLSMNGDFADIVPTRRRTTRVSSRFKCGTTRRFLIN